MADHSSPSEKLAGAPVHFGPTAADYATHRIGFPDSLFARLAARAIGLRGQTVVDLGTGTGVLARGFARAGCRVVGIDISRDLIVQASRLDGQAGVQVDYVLASAERLPLSAASADVVTAGQCWHWFDRRAALREVLRVLRPGGVLVLAAFDWLPFAGNVVERTEALIEQHNPLQPKPHVRLGMAAGVYPPFVRDLSEGGLIDIETWSYDHTVHYTHVGWRGRIRASQGVGASLSAPQVAQFDAELSALLSRDFPDEPMRIPHRVWVAQGRKAL